MPYRVEIPEGREPLVHILNHTGSEKLLDTRQRMFRTIYDAPETTLSAREREGMRIMGAARTNCPICAGMRLWRDWPGFAGGEIPEEFYQNAVDCNYEWEGFTPREKLLIEYADRFERDIESINGDDVLWERMHSLLTEAEIGDTNLMLGCWVGTGRVLKALGIGSVCVVPPSPETFAALRNDQLSEKADLVPAE